MKRRRPILVRALLPLFVSTACSSAPAPDDPDAGGAGGVRGSGDDASTGFVTPPPEGGGVPVEGAAPSSSGASPDASIGIAPAAVDAGAIREAAAPPADAGTAVSSDGCGARSGMRGLTMRSATVSGSNRTYLTYLPAALDPRAPVPVVFVFHGAAMSGQEMHDITQYTALSDALGAQGFAVVFPDGQGGPGTLTPWNVADQGQSVCGAGDLVNNANPVDFAFIDAMLADVARDQCLDPAHRFATGFSMGGYFSHHIGCERPDFRAVAPASGGTIADLSGCASGHVPIIIFHGTGDGLIADGCDDPNGTAQAGFPPSAALWAKKNGCKDTVTTMPTSAADGGAGQCYLYDGCPSDGQVELCTFTGMGHAWAGGGTAGQGAQFSAPAFASATQLEWDFFNRYAW